MSQIRFESRNEYKCSRVPKILIIMQFQYECLSKKFIVNRVFHSKIFNL